MENVARLETHLVYRFLIYFQQYNSTRPFRSLRHPPTPTQKEKTLFSFLKSFTCRQQLKWWHSPFIFSYFSIFYSHHKDLLPLAITLLSFPLLTPLTWRTCPFIIINIQLPPFLPLYSRTILTLQIISSHSSPLCRTIEHWITIYKSAVLNS